MARNANGTLEFLGGIKVLGAVFLWRIFDFFK